MGSARHNAEACCASAQCLPSPRFSVGEEGHGVRVEQVRGGLVEAWHDVHVAVVDAAGMLALARHHGWPTECYARVEHPVQQRCLEEVSRWTDLPQHEIGTAVDGCGVVCYGLPLRKMALAYARLANAEAGTRNAEHQR